MDLFDRYLFGGGDSTIQSLFHTSAYVIATCVVVLLTVYYRFNAADGQAKFPDFDPLKTFEFTNNRRTRDFIKKSIDTLTNGRARFGDKPYRLSTDWGDVVVLSPKMLNEIKSDKRLTFVEAAADDAHSYIPGFEPFSNNPAVPRLVNKHLTKALTRLTAPLSEEATAALTNALTDSPEWHDFNVSDDIMKIVSRLSARVFMGSELCQDEAWNEASTRYTSKAFQAGIFLREYPRWARPWVHWFMPACWEVRRAKAHAKKVLQPHLERRRQLKRDLAAKGEQHGFDDSIEWFEQEGCQCDEATGQITLALVAIHTTTDLLAQTMINLAQNPELFAPLRKEAVAVLTEDGLKKTALYNLKLMDSVIKETQRLKPITVGGFRRVSNDDMTLSDGTFLKKGTRIVIDSTHMWSQDYYDNANQFDGYRFSRMREAAAAAAASSSGPEQAESTPANSNKHAHLVSTSVGHLGFGHGLHSCPGRFFAANEIKIALCHLVLMYDWKVPEGKADLEPVLHGMGLMNNPNAKLLIRRRKEEIDFSSLVM